MPTKAKLPGRAKPTSLVLSPEQLAEFALIDSALPALVIQARNEELRRQFVYAVLSLVSGVIALLSVVVVFTYLVLQGHPEAAAGLLGAGVLGLVGGFVRSRL